MAEEIGPGAGEDEDEETVTGEPVDGAVEQERVAQDHVDLEWVERTAKVVHQAYLDTCARLGWPVKPSNQVPYEELSEEAKELDRAVVRAVWSQLTNYPSRGTMG